MTDYDSSNNGVVRDKRNWSRAILGVGVSILCLFVIVRQVDFADVADALAAFEWPFLIFGVASLAVGYILRISRWSLLLRATGAATTPWNCAAPFLGSIALNNVLPFRIGDVIRALVFPKAMGITKTVATSSLLIERLIDVMTLLVCLAVGLFAVQTLDIPSPLLDAAVVLAIVGSFALIFSILFSTNIGLFFDRLSAPNHAGETDGRLNKVYALVGGLLQNFGAMSQPRVLLSVIALSLLVWVSEAGLFYFVLLGFGFEAGPSLALLVMSIATFATLVPSSPGYVGSFHLAAFMAISLVGGSATQAGSYAVLVHLALWLPTTAAGAISILLVPELFHRQKSLEGSQ